MKNKIVLHFFISLTLVYASSDSSTEGSSDSNNFVGTYLWVNNTIDSTWDKVNQIYDGFLQAVGDNKQRLNQISRSLDLISDKIKEQESINKCLKAVQNAQLETALKEIQHLSGVKVHLLDEKLEKINEKLHQVDKFEAKVDGLQATSNQLSKKLEKIDEKLKEFEKLQAKLDGLEAKDIQLLNSLKVSNNKTDSLIQTVSVLEKSTQQTANTCNEGLQKINEKLNQIDKLEATDKQLLDSLIASTSKIDNLAQTVSVFEKSSQKGANACNEGLQKLNEKLNQIDQLEVKVNGLRTNDIQLLNSLKASTNKIDTLAQTVSVFEKSPQQAANTCNEGFQKINGKLHHFDNLATKVDGLQANSNQIVSSLKATAEKIDKLPQIFNESESDVISVVNQKCDLQTEDLIQKVKQAVELNLSEFLKAAKGNSSTPNSAISSIDHEGITKTIPALSAEQTNVPLTFRNCKKALCGNKPSGMYMLSLPKMNLQSFEAYCLKDDDGGAPWTIIQRRRIESIDFERNWHAYKEGFGNTSGDHWLGLEKIHALTNSERHELWVLAKTEFGRYFSEYHDNFVIGNEDGDYEVTSLGRVKGDFDQMRYCLNAEFYTYDKDRQVRAGFWRNRRCANLNNVGYRIFGRDSRGSRGDVVYVHMAIRPMHDN